MRRITRRFAATARGRRLRSRLEFAERCIVLPNEGPFKNQNWRPHFQPYTAAVLSLMDRLAYRKYRFTGCVQSGKSFVGVICVLWHLFERGENVGYAVPDLDQSARDKWHQEFLPVILASPELRKHLPESGEGSQGGTPSLIKFKNGASLRFISGTGKDHHRSNFTVDVVFKTEVDRYDTAGDVSRETSPPEQIENRIEAAGDSGFSYEECTVTEESGRIWTELVASTNHRLCVECVHCGAVVCPGREDLHGVEDASDVDDAGTRGEFRCSACQKPWTEGDRVKMLQNLIPVGEGQTATIGGDGAALVEGELKPTDRLGVSWNEFHNAFHTTSKIARDEFNALFSLQSEEMDLKRRQHAWTLPSEPETFAVTAITVRDILERGSPKVGAEDWRHAIRLGYAPPDLLGITAGVDVGKRWLHFVVRAFYKTLAGVNHRIIDLGEWPVRTDEIGIKRAMPEAIEKLSDRFNHGYAVWGDTKAPRQPVKLRGIDGGWQGSEIGKRQEDLVWLALLGLVHRDPGGEGWLMTLGRGQSEPVGRGGYSQPKKKSPPSDPNGVIWIGEQAHIRKSEKHNAKFRAAGSTNPACYALFNTDHHKEVLRTGYGDTPIGEDGAACSFNASTKDERRLQREYGKQVIAETRRSKPVKGRGRVVVFENDSDRPNHYGDADVIALLMGGVLELPVNVLPRDGDSPTTQPAQRTPIRTPSGQAFLATQR